MLLRSLFYLAFTFLVSGITKHALAQYCDLNSYDQDVFSDFHLLISPGENSWRAYVEKKELERKPIFVSIGPCPKNSNLMIDLAFEQPKNTLPVKDIMNLPEFYGDLTCEVKNNNLRKNINNDLLKSRLKQKHKFLRKCVQYRLKSGDKALMKYMLKNTPSVQYDLNKNEVCRITKLSDQEAIVNTEDLGICLFKTDPSTRFEMHFEINPKCTNLAYLNELGIQTQDLTAVWSVNQLDKFSGNANSVQLGSFRGNIHISPEKDSSLFFANLPVNKKESKSYLQPSYIDVWSPDISLFQLDLLRLRYKDKKLNKVMENTGIKVAFLVDNQCKISCKDRNCTAPCNYKTPVYSKVSLYQKAFSQKFTRSGSSWYTGRAAPAQWMGVIPAQFYRHPFALKEGRSYKLVFEFFNQRKMYRKFSEERGKLPWLYLSKEIENRLGKGPGGLDLLPELPVVKPIEEVEKIEEINPDFSVIGTDGIMEVSKQFWPPEYKYYCDDTRKKNSCVPMNGGKEISPFTLELRFKVEKVLENKYQLANMKVRRLSRIKKMAQCESMGGTTIKHAKMHLCEFEITKKPKIKCKFNHIER